MLAATSRALFASSKLPRSTLSSSNTVPSSTRAASPTGFPNALLMPSWSLSAPAVAIILFSLSTTWG